MILCVPPKTITPHQKGLLTKKGVIVIETSEPDKVRLLTPEIDSNIDSSDWFMAALQALTVKSTYNDRQADFVINLFKRLSEKEKLNSEPSVQVSDTTDAKSSDEAGK